MCIRDRNLFTIQFPITALSSISHRISGVILFFLTFPFISLVLVAIQSQEGFDYASALMAHFMMKSALTLYVAAIVYHFFSGLRHLAMDFGYWETLKASRYSAMIVYLLFLVMTVIFSILIW